MITASIREIRSSTKEIMQAVARGETVTITHRGKPFAQINSLTHNNAISSPTSETNDELFGIWRDRTDIGSVPEFVNKLRNGREFPHTPTKAKARQQRKKKEL